MKNYDLVKCSLIILRNLYDPGKGTKSCQMAGQIEQHSQGFFFPLPLSDRKSDLTHEWKYYFYSPLSPPLTLTFTTAVRGDLATAGLGFVLCFIRGGISPATSFRIRDARRQTIEKRDA